MKTKVCPTCKQEKPVEEFYKSKSTKSGYISYCKKCSTQKAREWKKQNPEYGVMWRKKNREGDRNRLNTWRRNNKDKLKMYKVKRKMFAIEYKGGKCEDCGIIGTIENRTIFDFHHTHPSSKDTAISHALTQSKSGLKSLKQELDKCVLLCSNCHKLRHQQYNEGLRQTL